MKEKEGWVLDGDKAKGILVVNTNGQRVELKPGEAAQIPGGSLRYERLSTWMGYKIFYDPTLQWMFGMSIIGVLGLFAHFWQKFGNWSAVTRAPGEGPAQPVTPQDALVNPVRVSTPQGERSDINKGFPKGNMA